MRHMLSWSLTFFVLALLAGFLGFTGIASAATDIAKLLFFVFLVLFVMSFFFRTAEAADDEMKKNLDL